MSICVVNNTVCVDLCTLLVGLAWGAATLENSTAAPQKIRNKITTGFSHPAFGYVSKIIEIRVLKRYLYLHVRAAVFTIAKSVTDE